jgi:hypothetical protein
MDRTTLVKSLEQAKRHAAEGERRIVELRQMISALTLEGRDIAEARRLFDLCEESQAMDEQHSIASAKHLPI